MARKERKYHYIYKITCLKNNRYYIGMHSTDNLEDGYMGGGKRIKNSVKKHGKDAHRKEILEFFENRESLRQREIQIINEDLLNDPLCMNLQPGGGGGFIDDSHQLKCSSAGGCSNSLRLKSDINHYLNFSSKISQTRRKRIEEGLIKTTIFNWSGRKHREETKKKIGESNSLKQTGEKNSQFGKKWIYNDLSRENRKIDKNDAIPEGWNLGRKMKFI